MEVIQKAEVKYEDYSSVEAFTSVTQDVEDGHCKYCIRTPSDYCN